jgi:hypothetical protein
MKFYKLDPSVIEKYKASKSSPINLIVGTHNKKIRISKPERYRIKIYKFGDIYEFYIYEIPVFIGFQKSNCELGRDTTEEVKIENRIKVVTRIRNRVRRLTLANFNENSKFFTATFAENITDMEFANYEFMKFIQRLKYHYGDFKYLVVVEFQDRGAIHYHMISDFGYIKHSELAKIWGNGFVWIRDLLKSNNGKPVDNVGAYIVKYMNKDVLDERLMGKKAYFTSRNLKRPEIFHEDLSLQDCLKKYGLKVDDLVFNNSFMSKENGRVDYLEFNKKR